MKLRIEYTMTAPVSHIGETASTGSYFQTIKTKAGRLPIITANSVRGIIRDNGAKCLLDTIGVKVGKEAFNVLFSGGNLNGTMKNDVAKAKAVREHFPLVSLLGGGLGDMIMAGKIAVGNLYPVCNETQEMLGIDYPDISWKNLIDEIEFTRTDDGKDDQLAGYMEDPEEEKKAKASTQMRYSVQYMAQGTKFSQRLYIFPNATELEIGALYSAVAEWFKIPRLGGMASKGFGFFDAVTDFGISVKDGRVTVDDKAAELIEKYRNFVAVEGSEYLYLLGGKNGKK